MALGLLDHKIPEVSLFSNTPRVCVVPRLNARTAVACRECLLGYRGKARESLTLIKPVRQDTRVQCQLRKRQEARDVPTEGALESSRNEQARDPEKAEDKGVQAALGALHWYKRTVSPLLPRSCRYLPTCSEYSMIAYKKFGVGKGTILTAWRLLRCNPLNFTVRYQGTYDPPEWPPMGFKWLAK